MSDTPPKPIVLLAFANDRDDRVRYLRNLPEETRRLRQTLERAQRHGLCELVVRPNATVAEILDVFQHPDRRNRVAVLHYGGHASSYQLLFETAKGQPAPADADAFARFLGQQSGLKLVFLNGCSTQAQAQGLLDAGVSVVTATAQAIDDGVATEFADRFYRGLASGATIRMAFDEARAAVQTMPPSTHDRGTTRNLYSAAAQESFVADRWPWDLYLREGAEEAAEWNLPEAAGDPLFGLPLLPELDLPGSPYRHLQWYRREDAGIFFGRGREIRDLYERVTAPRTAPILLFYGQSGVGKSSLLAAGLLPRLEDDYAICYARRDQALGLLGTLQAALADGARARDLASSWLAIEERESSPLLVVLDQVEERFTRPNPTQSHELADFLAALRGAFADPDRRPQGKLILGFRKEWLAEIEKRMAERELPRTKVFLERLEREGIEEVVAGPARTKRLQDQYGLTVEANLPRVIADDLLADPGSPVAPTLQILLCRMWERATARDYDQPRFDGGLYDELRAEGLGLGDFLEQQFQALHEQQPAVVDSGLALDLLAYHTTPLGTAEERAREELQTTYRHRKEVLPDLLQHCQDLCLLVDPAQNAPDRPPASRLTHDTLAPVVHHRFDESDRPGQRARRIVENRAVGWAEGKEGTPLDEADLTVVEDGASGMRAWTAAEERLVVASRRERERRQRNRRIWQGVGILAIALILIAAGLAFWQWQEAAWQGQRAVSASATAQAEASIALSRQLAAQAVNSVESRRLIEQGLLLAVEAFGATPDSGLSHVLEADDALRRALAVAPLAILRHEADVGTVTFDPDGTRLATASDDGTACLWDATTGEELAVLHHKDMVFAAVFSPDGTRLATGCADGTARLWDAATGEELAALRHEDTVWAVAFSPDGTRLATGSEDGAARLWDANTHEELAVLHHDDAVLAVTFSPDGTQLATGSEDYTARLWDVSTGEELAALRHEDTVRAVTFKPDGTRLATGSFDSTARLWDANTHEELAVLHHDDAVWAVTFSPDGTQLATGSDDRTARLWDANTGQQSAILRTEDSVRAVAFSPDGTWLAGAGRDGTASLWEANTREELALLRHDDAVLAVTFSSDGTRLATASDDGTARLWDPATETEPVTLHHDAVVWLVTFSPDGTRLASASKDGTARLWNATTGEELAVLRHEDVVWAVTFSPDGTRLATGSEDDAARLWDATTGQELAVLHHKGEVGVVTFSPDGTLLATGSDDGTARLADASTGEELAILRTDDAVWSVAFSPDGTRVAAGSDDGTVRLASASTGEELAILRTAGWVRAIAFSPDGTRLAASSADGTVRLMDATSGEELVTLRHDDAIWSVAFSPDGTRLATASEDSTARLWDAATGEVLAVLRHDDAVWTIIFNADGTRLATGSTDGTARLWDATTGQELAVLRHEDVVRAITFSPDGTRLATASKDATAHLADASTGEVLAVLRAGEPLRAVAFSPDGTRLATASRDGAVRLWRVHTKDLAAVTCDIVSRDLTYVEWMQFLGVEPYRATCPNIPLRPLELLKQAEAYALARETESAAAAAAQAVAVAIETDSRGLNGDLCRLGSLKGFAEIVLPACENAVSLADDEDLVSYRDSRGLARALTGDYTGAIEDFQSYIDHADDEVRVAMREAWIAELERGQNPFDDETLRALRNE